MKQTKGVTLYTPLKCHENAIKYKIRGPPIFFLNLKIIRK